MDLRKALGKILAKYANMVCLRQKKKQFFLKLLFDAELKGLINKRLLGFYTEQSEEKHGNSEKAEI